MKITGITLANNSCTKNIPYLSRAKGAAAVSFGGDREVAYLLTQALRHAQTAKDYIGAQDPESFTNDRQLRSYQEANGTLRTDTFLNAALHDGGFASFAENPQQVLDIPVVVAHNKPYHGTIKTTLRETIVKPNKNEEFDHSADAVTGGFYHFKDRFISALNSQELGFSEDAKKSYAKALDVLESLNPFKQKKS